MPKSVFDNYFKIQQPTKYDYEINWDVPTPERLREANLPARFAGTDRNASSIKGGLADNLVARFLSRWYEHRNSGHDILMSDMGPAISTPLAYVTLYSVIWQGKWGVYFTGFDLTMKLRSRESMDSDTSYERALRDADLLVLDQIDVSTLKDSIFGASYLKGLLKTRQTYGLTTFMFSMESLEDLTSNFPALVSCFEIGGSKSWTAYNG